MNAEDDITRRTGLIQEAFAALGKTSPGWDLRRVGYGLIEIARFVAFAKRVPVAYRRSEAAKAREQLADPHFLTTANPEELDSLRWLADQFQVRPGRGGDRRTGSHNVRGSVLRMAIRLYIDATGRRGFSWNSPMIKFCDCVFRLSMDDDRKIVVTAEMVHNAHRRLRKELPPARPRARLHYSTIEVAAGRKKSATD
jgi:hypothetical protein